MREFFGFGGYQREAEGAFSWQHLTFVTMLMIIMTCLAIWLGRKYRNSDDKAKNRVLIWAAILIDGLELFKIVLSCVEDRDPLGWIYVLPLFLCSIQLITIPLAAFSSGRIKEASLDFISIFGLLGAVLGTYLATQNYNAYPVLSFTNVVSGITHSISGFAALYIMIVGMASMKPKNTWISCSILSGFGICAYIVNRIFEAKTGDSPNYMFLMGGDGTPYDIIYNLVDGNRVIYPLTVMLLFFIYIFVFSRVYLWAVNRKNRTEAGKESPKPEKVAV